jgi:hypothetical protein
MNEVVAALNDGYVDKLRKCRPLETAPPPAATFEIGLVLAGAVSAGAYTAGVLDFLIEALDAWYDAKESERAKHGDDLKAWAVPPHDLTLKVISGASAGSMVGAISAAALQYDFPHIRDKDRASGPANPLYKPWVLDIDISKLLGSKDFDKVRDRVVSLLDSTALMDIATTAINFKGRDRSRPYLANPLKLLLTVTNLRGIPYALNLRGTPGARHEMECHADHVRFALLGFDGRQPGPLCSDETPLTFPKATDDDRWTKLAWAALASGAFPLFLQPRGLSRQSEDYDYRFIALPGGMDPLIAQILPSWPSSTADPYDYLCVDGGAMDNEPLELARVELAGLLGRNPREGIEAYRAIVLVDPFPDPAEMGPASEEGSNVLKIGLSLAGAWEGQARFKPVDLALAHLDSVYSRFIIAPSRGAYAASPLASGGLGGFLGFFHEGYRHHDFILGRRNCQAFLRQHFTLPPANPLFAGWSSTLKNDPRYQAVSDGQFELPIIPLLGKCHPDEGEEALPSWPKGLLDPKSLRSSIQNRLQRVYDAALAQQQVTWPQRSYLWVGWNWAIKPRLAEKAVDAIRQALLKRGL